MIRQDLFRVRNLKRVSTSRYRLVCLAPKKRDDLNSFLSGEGRLVYARYKDDPHAEPYFLEDGTASEPGMRNFVREKLECLMPLLMTCLAVGVPVFWLNPTEQLIATPFREAKIDADVWTVTIDGRQPGKVDAGVRIEPFDIRSRLPPAEGLVMPGLHDLLADAAEFDASVQAALDRWDRERQELRERARIHAMLDSEECNEWEAELPPKRQLRVPRRRPLPGPADPVWSEPWMRSPSETRPQT